MKPTGSREGRGHGLLCAAVSLAFLALPQRAAAQTLQTFAGAPHETPYTRGATPGYGGGPLAPTLGYLQVVNPATPGNQRPYVAFDTTPDLSGTQANGSVVIEFDYRIPASGSADGFGVALLSTSVHGSTGALAAGSNILTSAFNWEQPKPASSFAVGFDIYGGAPDSKNQISLNWNGAKVANVQTDASSFSRYELRTGQWARVRIEVRKSGADSRVTVKLTSSSDTANPTTYTPFDDQLVTGMNLGATRLAFGVRTGGLTMLLDLDNVRTRRINESVVVASRTWQLDDGALPPATPGAQPQFHVNPVTGVDTNSGASSSPLKTIKKAVEKAAPGDKVILSSGTHTLSNGNGTPATVFLDKRVIVIGQGDSGSGKTTVTGDWTDTIDDQFDLGNALFAVNPNGDGSSFQGIEFKGGPGRPGGVNEWQDSYRPIGGGIRLNAVHDVTIDDTSFLNFHASAIYLWENRRLRLANTDITDCGYGNTVLAPGAEGSEAGAVKFVSMYDSTFENILFKNLTGNLGTGYGIKVTGAIVNNTFRDITCDLKGASSWQNGAGAGAAPTFFMEATAQKHNISQGFKASDVVGNVISGCDIRNPFSLQMGGGGMHPLPVGTISFHLHDNVIESRGEYVIEGGTDNMLLEYNHSKTLSFYNNSGASGTNITIRFNVVENVDDYFVRIKGPSDGLKVHHNTVTTQNRLINGNVRKPAFVRIESGALQTAGLSESRDIRNNVVVGPGGTGTLHFVKLTGTPAGNYTNFTLTKNHVYLGQIGVYSSSDSLLSGQTYLNLTGNQGGTAASNDPDFTGGNGIVWERFEPLDVSPLRNVGANLGLPGTDSTPDIGAVQYSSEPGPGDEGWWRFEEGSGTNLANSVPGGGGGTINGATWTTGKSGNGLQFGGTNHVELSGYSAHDSDEGSFTAWIKTTQTTEGMIFYGTGVTGGNGFGDQDELHVNVGVGGKLELFINGTPATNNVRITSAAAVNNNQWRHVAATWKKGGQAVLYLDGVSVGSVAHNANSFAFTQSARLGLTAVAARGFNGTLDEARLYNRALTAAEIALLPSPWTSQDIGTVVLAGAASQTSGTWTLDAAGADIWGTADAFHYAHQAATGDCQIIARVTAVENTNSWAKAGVMIRESTAAGSRFALLVQRPDKQVAFQWRGTTGGSAAGDSTPVGGTSEVKFLRITRTGNNFSAFYSTTGASGPWTQVGAAQSIAMASGSRIGLAATSHNTSTVGTSVIDHVNVTP